METTAFELGIGVLTNGAVRKAFYVFFALDTEIWTYFDTKEISRVYTYRQEAAAKRWFFFDRYRILTKIDYEGVEHYFRMIFGKSLNYFLQAMHLILVLIVKYTINVHFAHHYIYATYEWVPKTTSNSIYLIQEYLKHICFMKGLARTWFFEIIPPLITQSCVILTFYWVVYLDHDDEDDDEPEDCWVYDNLLHMHLSPVPYGKWSQKRNSKFFIEFYIPTKLGLTLFKNQYYYGRNKHIKLERLIFENKVKWKLFWIQFAPLQEYHRTFVKEFKQYLIKKKIYLGLFQYAKIRIKIFYDHYERYATKYITKDHFLMFFLRYAPILFIVWEFYAGWALVYHFDKEFYFDDMYNEPFHRDPTYCTFEAAFRNNKVMTTEPHLAHQTDWRKASARYYKQGPFRKHRRSHLNVYVIRKLYIKYGHSPYKTHYY